MTGENQKKDGEPMNDLDRLRARILAQKVQEPQREATSSTTMNVLLVTLTLGFLFAVAVRLL